MMRENLRRGFLLFVLMMLITGIFEAQEATPEATIDVTPVATEVAPEAVVVPPVVSASEIVINVGVVVGGIIAVFLGGAVTGVSSFLVAIRSMNANQRYAMEQLALSLPANTLQSVRSIISTVKDAASLADELTDGVFPSSPSAPAKT